MSQLYDYIYESDVRYQERKAFRCTFWMHAFHDGGELSKSRGAAMCGAAAAHTSFLRRGGINKARKVTETRHLLMAWLGLACQLPCFTSFYSCSVNLVMVGICDIEIFIRLARQKACKIQGHHCSSPPTQCSEVHTAAKVGY